MAVQYKAQVGRIGLAKTLIRPIMHDFENVKGVINFGLLIVFCSILQLLLHSRYTKVIVK